MNSQSAQSAIANKSPTLLQIEAKKIDRSLAQVCELSGKRRIAWIKSDGEVGTLALYQRFFIWISFFFHREERALHYFTNYSQTLPTMLKLATRFDQLSPLEPQLVEHYWKAWRVFNTTFHVKPEEKICQQAPSAALIRGSRSKEDISSLLECYCPPYSSKQLVLDFANQGLLSAALWVLQAKGLKLKNLASELPSADYRWMELQTSFKASASTPLDVMALTSHEGKLGLGWGYKSANLSKLKATTAQISRQCMVCDVKVPAFFPLGDTEMQRYIQKGYPELSSDWSSFLSSFPPAQKKAFLEGSEKSLGLLPEGKKILKSIRERLLQQFLCSSYITPQIQDWLETQKPSFVIVRSSGKEDSATNSNAGGNASIPYVKPEAESLSAAMGEVLASYFSEKSLLQRLAAHDTSIFTEPPFMPLLIQEMVSENVGGVGTPMDEVPRSGVMFTQSGGKAKGLTELYVGLGNNEGIVSSRVNTDHYLLDAHGGVTKVVHDKNTRFVAIRKSDGSYECEAIANDSNLLCHAPALPDSIAIDMKRVADYFSREYGQDEQEAALDIEFTIKMSEQGGNATIYLLQARPLVSVAKEYEPSYIDLSQIKTGSSELLQGKTLLDGGSYVRQITSSDELLVCDTITEALERYLLSPHQKQIKTILIKKPAPGTSHEAVTFRASGVGVLIIDNPISFSRAADYASKASTDSFLIDLQRGVIAPNGLQSQAIHQGYVCYPMPLEYSMIPSKLIVNLHHKIEHPELKDAAFEAQTEKLFLAFKSSLEKVIAACLPKGTADLASRDLARVEELQGAVSTQGKSGKTLQQLLEIMAEGDEVMAKLAAASLLQNLKSQLVNPESHLTGYSRLELMMILENMAAIVKTQFLPATASPGKSLERLYPVRLIEACLFQETKDVFGAFSYVSCMKAEKNQKAIIEAASDLFGHAIPLQKSLQQAPFFKTSKALLKPENKKKWEALIKHLPSISPGVLEPVRQLLIDLDSLGSLAEWSNVEFVKLLKKKGLENASILSQKDAQTIFGELATIAKQGQSELATCKKRRKELATLQLHMNVWDDPSYIKKQAAALFTSFQKMGLTEGDELSRNYASCPASFRMVYLKTLIEAVRTYDEIIKTCKSSTKYPNDKEKAMDVHKLLIHYRVMMQALLKTANSQGLYTSMGSTASGYSMMSVETYLHNASHGKNYTFGFSQSKKTPGFLNLNPQQKSAAECSQLLLPSKDFNVAMAVVGNQSDYTFSTVWPETLEDYFTFFHQNMEVCVSGLRTKCGFSKDLLPSDLESYCSNLIKSVAPQGKASILSSISVEGPLIYVAIDVPLRQHAGKLLISYDRSQSPAIMQTRVEFFGNAEHNRWELTASAAALIGSDMPNLHLTGKPTINFQLPQSAIFELETCGMSDSEGAALTTFLANLCKWSMGPTGSAPYIEAVDTLRRAFKGPSAPLSSQDLSQGAFFLSLDVAQAAVAKGDYVKAGAIIARLKELIQAKPWIKNLTLNNQPLLLSLFSLSALCTGHQFIQTKANFVATHASEAIGHLKGVGTSIGSWASSFFKGKAKADPAVITKRKRITVSPTSPTNRLQGRARAPSKGIIATISNWALSLFSQSQNRGRRP